MENQIIEDYSIFLNRKPIKTDLTKASEFIKGKRVLVTGGCGSIGSELVKQLIKLNPSSIIIFDNAESPMFYLQQEISKLKTYTHIKFIIGDVRDVYRVDEVFKTYMPNIVFHSAAYKHVPMMESNSIEAVKTNVLGTKHIADAAYYNDIEAFVLISTDKAVNPTNIMGATKRISEIYVQFLNSKSNTAFITTRFGNVLGSQGSVIPIFMKQIKDGGPVCVTHKDVIRYFMTIPEACQLVLQASTLGRGGEIFLFDMGEPVKIINLAKNIIKYYGDDSIKIKIIGLRPGEKLYEELLCDGESAETQDENIMLLRHPELDFKSLIPDIEKLSKYKMSDTHGIISLIKNIVPEFKREAYD